MFCQKRLKISSLAIRYTVKCRKATSLEKTYALPWGKRRQDGILLTFHLQNDR
jgi:hypothetical protein